MTKQEIQQIWNCINSIDDLSYKLKHIESVASLLAENMPENDHSNVAWLISDLSRKLYEEINCEIENYMEYRRLANTPKKKAKK